MKRLISLILPFSFFISMAGAQILHRYASVVEINLLTDTFLVLDEDGEIWKLNDVSCFALLDELWLFIETNENANPESWEVIEYVKTGSPSEARGA